MSNYNEIDITDWDIKRTTKPIDFGNQITNAVKDTQRLLIRPYPNKLKMTKRQYNFLNNRTPDTPLVFDNRLFKTNYNIMDIEIEGHNKHGERI